MDLLSARRLAICAFLLVGARARAELASPGDLAKAHAKLDGIGNCNKCHPAGKQLSADSCFVCHAEVGKRAAAGRGFHGRLGATERAACNTCHREHEGRDFQLIEWKPSKERFDHARTGWPLKGKHAGQKCATCHEPRRIVDADAQALVKRGAETYLGVGTRCATCHFDEHRGQLGAACDHCHGETSWKPAPRFDHGKTRFPLAGKHQPVECARCHTTLTDEKDRPTFPPPRARTFARYADVPHERCNDCHADPHDGRFGGACESCHTVDGWKLIHQTSKERAFHDRTRYPLRGLHAAVACVACHGPAPGRPAKFKGLAFEKCRDCHVDAHGGQLKDPDCERCHSVNGFRPATFELEDHQKTRYPLLGSHAAVPCSSCHPSKPIAPSPAKLDRRKKAPPPGPHLAAIALKLPDKGEACEGCHHDVHVGQFSDVPGGCRRCHDVKSFKEARVDHEQTQFPLTGAHGKVACDSCHRPVKINGIDAVRYRPLDTNCVGCHADVHLGQFKPPGCERCHTTEAFAKTTFNHDDRHFTTFPLDGRHKKVACADCHRPVALPGGKWLQRYRPLPRDCETCHADFHRGDFRGFAVTATGVGRDERGRDTRCGLCHVAAGWDEVRFPHERTGFPLAGRHARVDCKGCHPTSFKARVPDRCAACHRDRHAGEFGQRCEGCHNEESWRTTFSADAHRATNFPLSGRHALIPCVECHPQARDRGFSRAQVACVACHQADYDRTAAGSIDHARSGFTTECRGCHSSTRWRPARFPQHDRCFRIVDGPHAGIRCVGCHTTIPSVPMLGACASNTAACTSCHTHAKAQTDAIHAAHNVAGYDYKDAKCYLCHPFK